MSLIEAESAGNFAGKSYLILSGEFVYYHEKGKAETPSRCEPMAKLSRFFLSCSVKQTFSVQVILDNEAGWIAESPVRSLYFSLSFLQTLPRFPL